MSATESPKQKEKAMEAIDEPQAVLEAEVVNEIDQTKKKSSASGVEMARELPQPPVAVPAKPKKVGKSLLATDTGEDVQFLDDDESDDDEIDLIAMNKEKEKQKPRMSFSFRFFGGGSKKKIPKSKNARPGSMFAFLLPKPANSTYNNVKGKVESEDSRMDSVAWRRKESKELTKSLQMDMDIYQYLKERSPSFEEEEKLDIDEPMKSVIPPPKVKRKKVKGGTTSNLLVGGGDVREATKAPHVELARRKRRGFFGRFKLFGRSNKDKAGRPGFASRMLSRMSFRPTSYVDTTADEMRQLLEASETKGSNKDSELYRKDSDDSNASDETDLSADIDIDSTLLVKDGETNTPKAATDAIAKDEEVGRVSKIFDEEDEDKPKTKAAVLKSEMSKSSDELRVLKPIQNTSKSTEDYLDDDEDNI